MTGESIIHLNGDGNPLKEVAPFTFAICDIRNHASRFVQKVKNRVAESTSEWFENVPNDG